MFWPTVVALLIVGPGPTARRAGSNPPTLGPRAADGALSGNPRRPVVAELAVGGAASPVIARGYPVVAVPFGFPLAVPHIGYRAGIVGDYLGDLILNAGVVGTL